MSVLFILATSALGENITRIASLGNLDFSVDLASTTASYEQSVSAISFAGSQSLGDTLGGLWINPTPKDWSQYSLSNFGLLGKVTGANPSMPFTLEFFDTNLEIVNTFEGSTVDATSIESFMNLTLSTPGNGNMNDIFGMQFTWDSPGSINFDWEGLAVVPEPKTYLLLILGAFALTVRHRWVNGRF